ncbi:hypothetical protein DB35_18840 [Streptomyces abyssalis]|uniref:Uncharacterized protein n=1 Tax=Streptomyces abyssalis TaxID=933944 RepID=A0A1E7JL57_9ACTN|nr:hypothetical protein [Streptomyces abyssalis]OEU88376.1 hypothetical protein AN215_19985 [Streptomyces abyssalis]OEU89113.1 hypothetical protein DB35_18840 [Streptomyces abyssalis]OEV30000.1 hypothetical protein AN219_13360 [Streptomyces nanshensis]
MTTTVSMATVSPSRSLGAVRTTGQDELPLPPGVWLEAPLWLLAGVEDEEEISFEPNIWRGID